MTYRDPYVDSFWATKKRQIPFQCGNVMIIWETSYGMTLKNPGQLPSETLREAVDDAIDRAFTVDLERFTNNEAVRKMIKLAMEHQGEPVSINASIEDIENAIEHAENLTDDIPPAEGDIAGMNLEQLIKNGLLTVGTGHSNT